MHSEAAWIIVWAIYSLWLFWSGYSYGRIFGSISRIEKILKRRASENSTDGQNQESED